MTIRVAIVEDDFFAREALATWLQRDTGIRVVGEYPTLGEVVLDEALAAAPAVWWIDLDGPFAMDGAESVRWVRAVMPTARILASALQPRPEHPSLWAQGVEGLVLKHECAWAAGVAVRAVAAGWRVLTPGLLSPCGDGLRPADHVLPTPQLPHDLPAHLRRILYLRYVRQLTPDQIAAELVLSANTVESYLKIVKSALQLEGREQLLTRGFMALLSLAADLSPEAPGLHPTLLSAY